MTRRIRAATAPCQAPGRLSRFAASLALAGALLCVAHVNTYAQATGSVAIPSPRDVLGHDIGERFTDAAGVVRYMTALADATPEVQIRRYGETLEGRELVQVVFARAGRMSRLDELLALNRELAEPATSERRAREIAATNPMVIYFSFGIHGNESSSSEAAMWLAWELARNTPSLAGVLDSAIVVMDPVLNPDGRDRYVNWFRQVRALRPNASPQSWEHDEPWPGGRFNHYLFDLNRDWAWLTQPESRMRRVAWSQWAPQVHVDFHEMGWTDNYLFFPAEEPINPLYPQQTLRWSHYFGQANASAFDRRGWPYYTGEWFDFWYPSYGDTWASFLGAIGMTYEQGGGGGAGIAVARRDGLTLTLRDRADGHRTAGEATLLAAVAARHEMLLTFAEFHRTADAGLPDILIVPGADASRADALVALLRDHEIRVERAGRSFRANGQVHPGFRSRRDFPAGTYLVRARQPWGRLALTLLLPEIELDATYTYDASSWSLPYGFGVEAHRVQRAPDADWRPVTELHRPVLANRFLPPHVEGGLQWSQWEPDRAAPATATGAPAVRNATSPANAGADRRPPGDAGGAIATDAVGRDATVEPYGFLLPPDMAGWPGIVRYMEDGGRVLVLVQEFVHDGRRWPAGTIFLPRHGVAAVDDRVRRAGLAGRAVAVASGRALEGRDLGTRTSLRLALPRVAVLTGDGVAPTSFGAHWFFLEQTLGLRFDAVRLAALRRLPLHEYDVIVVPELTGGGAPFLDEERIAELRGWVRSGGTLVAVGSGARTLAQPLAEIAVREWKDDADDEARLERALRGREARDVARWESEVPGAVIAATLDTDHPLAFGVGADGQPDRVFVFHRGPLVFEPDARFESVAFFGPELQKVSGVIAPAVLQHLSRGTWLAQRQLGAGRVILFADDPVHRHFWFAGFQPYINALLLAPAMGR